MNKKQHPLYTVHRNMLLRCYKPRHKSYKDYGGRGIKVCDRWHDLYAFAEDMGERPGPEYSLERINNDGNYEPGNCKWATAYEQGRNKRSNKLFTINGKTQTQQEWAREVGISNATLMRRLQRGWSLEKALTPELGNGAPKYIEFNGERKTMNQWAKTVGVNAGTFGQRVKRWGIEKALTIPPLKNGHTLRTANPRFRDEQQ